MISKQSEANTPGNYRLKDQIMALEWILQNIHFLGGNASNVVIAGHGSGATLIYGLLASKKARGLFSQAIASFEWIGRFQPDIKRDIKR